MVTRFSASDARLKAEQAKKTFEEQRQIQKELKRKQVKERAAIRVGFKKQRETILSAAIDGNTEIEVDSVFLFRELVDFGVQVIEAGLVKRQPNREEEEEGDSLDVDVLEISKAKILECFDNFIDDAKSDLKVYYGGFQRFHRLNYDALYEAITSERSWSEFTGDDVYIEQVPDDIKARYRTHIEKINENIRAIRGLGIDYDNFEDSEDSEDYFGDSEDNGELITGEYFFGDDDEELDVLRPSAEGNKLKIRWSSEHGSNFMNAPLLSDLGLAWLSTDRGQSLIEVVFYALSDAAENGKSNLELNFSLTKDGWYFLFYTRKIFCCMPDELVDIIAYENFTIDDTIATEKSYLIKVSW
jgi:hypothetical protein